MPNRKLKGDTATTAKLLVVLLAFAWGLNWVAAAFALRELTPWSLRVVGSAIGAATLFLAAIVSGHNLKVPRGDYIHVMVAGLFNVAGFQILSGFAQLSGATTRAIIITYSMPIWTTVLSHFVLGERLNAIRWFAFALCVVGVSVLLWPLFADGVQPFVFLFAWLCAQLDYRNRLHQMGQSDDRAAGKCCLAIIVRSAVHHRRFILVRRTSAALANK
jgi:drug/metabolite transporter (DMT)-like permease